MSRTNQRKGMKKLKEYLAKQAALVEEAERRLEGRL
jgi:hypothetical protein